MSGASKKPTATEVWLRSIRWFSLVSSRGPIIGKSHLFGHIATDRGSGYSICSARYWSYGQLEPEREDAQRCKLCEKQAKRHRWTHLLIPLNT